MRRGMVLAQLAVFALISLLIVGYTVFGLLRVDVVHSPFPVTVQLHEAGGVFEGSEVAYRGVKVGRVSSVELHRDGVMIRLAVDHGVRVPDNSVAHVYDLSAAGEQYVDLRPPERDASTTFLHAGSVIPATRTTTPLETATVLYDLEQFVDSLRPTDVRVLATEGARAFTGTGSALRSILTNTNDVVGQLARSEPAMLRLLDNSALLLRGAAEHTDALDSFTTSLRALTSTLAASTPTLTTLLKQSAPTTRLVDSVVRSTGTAFVPLLDGLATLSTIQVTRVPGLRTLLVAVPEFATLAPQIFSDGALHGLADFNQTQAMCSTGVPLTSPLSGIKTPVRATYCGTSIVRGAANAPRPSSGSSASSVSASALPASAGTQVGGYDPGTGLVSTDDGTMLRLGADGVPAVLGQDSWQSVLLAGISS